jgi:phage protein D
MKPLRLIDPRNDKIPELRVPQFEVRIEGAGLPKDVLRDVSEITYRDSLTELGQFELTVNNWDHEQRQFKYIGSETTQNKNIYPYNLFEPCGKKVRISFGYINGMTSMMVGTFTTMETSFNQSGGSTLTVRGLDDFHSMRRKKYSTSWTKKTPSEIAKDIGSKSDKGKRRFPLEVRILKGTDGREKKRKIDFVAQSSQFDIDFLLNLARQHGYEIYIEYDDKNRDKAVALCFGNPSDEPTILRLDWGQTLIDFKPTLTTAGQFKSITVKGWDRRTQKPIVEKIDCDDKELRGLNKKFGELVKQCDPQENETYSLPVFSKADAHARALALMRDNSARIIRATGTTIGFPELRAGTKLQIFGVGARLSGEYLVLKSTHTIGEGGYTTKFECRLEDYDKQGKSS